jgi:hypothetical protein
VIGIGVGIASRGLKEENVPGKLEHSECDLLVAIIKNVLNQLGHCEGFFHQGGP